jgi:indole-3-glycerol phosphate synthase
MKLPEEGPKGKAAAFLPAILQAAADRVAALRPQAAGLERAAAAAPAPLSFAARLTGPTLGLIAEVKRRSPSAGAIARDLDPATHACAYESAGASAISVLTEPEHFGGTLADLAAVRAAVGLPLLRKDFIIDELQLLEARAAGAAAALLIVRILTPARLSALARFAAQVGLETLVEAHTAAEVGVAVESGARVIGVNSRDLDSFAVDREGAWGLLGRIPAGRVAVAESGIGSAEDAARAAAAGADAVLVGAALSGSGDPGALVRAIRGITRRGR